MSRRSTVAQSKEAEREVARLLGGRRLHAGEWQGPGDVDVIGPTTIAQVKHRSGVPNYIIEGMRQIHEAAEATEELRRLEPNIVAAPIPVVILRTKPGRGREAQTFLVLDASCWSRLKIDGNPGS